MKAKEVMKLLNICRQTLYLYNKKNIIKSTKTPTGKYIYDDDSVYSFIGKGKNKTDKNLIVSYTRVSTQAQKKIS